MSIQTLFDRVLSDLTGGLIPDLLTVVVAVVGFVFFIFAVDIIMTVFDLSIPGAGLVKDLKDKVEYNRIYQEEFKKYKVSVMRERARSDINVKWIRQNYPRKV